MAIKTERVLWADVARYNLFVLKLLLNTNQPNLDVVIFYLAMLAGSCWSVPGWRCVRRSSASQLCTGGKSRVGDSIKRWFVATAAKYWCRQRHAHPPKRPTQSKTVSNCDCFLALDINIHTSLLMSPIRRGMQPKLLPCQKNQPLNAGMSKPSKEAVYYTKNLICNSRFHIGLLDVNCQLKGSVKESNISIYFFFPPITQWCSISDVLFTGGRGVSDFSVLKYY